MKLKKLFFTVIAAIFTTLTFAQEYTAPMLYNPQLYKGQNEVQKIAPNTFDSTFIYRTDTLKLTLTNKILDDFSTDKFQQYHPDYNDPTVTFEKYYKLMNRDGVTPLPADARFHNQITVRRTYDPAQNTLDVQPLQPDTIKYSDLSAYPPVYQEVKVYPPYDINDTIGSQNPPDTVYVDPVFYVQDSATQFFALSIDSNALWKDHFVFHNYTMARDPWTLGVATFDGLDQNGYPYLINSTVTGVCDFLTSKPIDMSSLDPSMEVYLSFLYQPEGFGDAPEAEDSLVLQFYSPSQNQWVRVWGVGGDTVSDFKKAHIKIDDPAFFENGFQFRFYNIGRLAGDLDNFHLDYVFLRSGSGPADTLFKDFAFVYPLNTFLKDYTSVPWDHYKDHWQNKMSDSVKVVVRNGSNLPENSQSGTAWVEQNGSNLGSFVLSDYELTNHDPSTNYAPLTTFTSYHDFSSGYHFDENTPGDDQTFELRATATVPYSQLTINDSTFGYQVFSNYYAYDDGSAEQAYGINGAQAELAYQFTPYEADSVIGISMSFVPTVEDVTNKLFLLTIWDDNDGKPGNKIYEDNFFFPRSPNYGYGHNSFINYYTQDTVKVPVNGTFYVGWRQIDNAKMCIGLDRNIDNHNKIFYSTNGGATWQNSIFKASLLMRPIFSTALDDKLGVKKVISNDFEWSVYPNPATNQITIRTNNPNYDGARLFDLEGRFIQAISKEETTMDISNLKSGMYLLIDNSTQKVSKIIKQ